MDSDSLVAPGWSRADLTGESGGWAPGSSAAVLRRRLEGRQRSRLDTADLWNPEPASDPASGAAQTGDARFAEPPVSATPPPRQPAPPRDAAPEWQAALPHEAPPAWQVAPPREAPSEWQAAPREAPSAWQAAPVREAAPAWHAAPVREAAPAWQAAPVREAAPAWHAAPVREAPPAWQSPPVHETEPAWQAEHAWQAAPVREAPPSRQAQSAPPAWDAPPGGSGPSRHAGTAQPTPEQVSPPDVFFRPATPVRRMSPGRWLLRALFFAGLVACVAPWWVQTSAESLSTTAGVLTAAGRITGLVGGYILLVQIVLTSRLGWLERSIGTRHMLLWHRELGGSVVVIILAHVALIILGYAKFRGVSVFAQSWTIVTRYEDMVSATIATVILTGTGLLGIRAIRRALPYEMWHLLHLTTYLILLLGYGHQFAAGQQLSEPGPARYGWIALYVGVLAVFAWGRVVEPVRLNLRHRLHVVDVVPEAADTVSVYVAGRDLDRLQVRAGQFFRWRFLTRGRWWQSHPFSLSAAPHSQWLRLTAKSVGDHTGNLAQLRVGARVLIGGPSGDFTAERRTRGGSLLIAAGSGIAPVRAVLEELPAGAVVIYRARDEVDVAFGQELDWLAQTRHATIWYVIGRREDPEVQWMMSPDGLRQLVPDVARRDVYLCGPQSFVDHTIGILRRLRVRRRHIHVDPFEF